MGERVLNSQGMERVSQKVEQQDCALGTGGFINPTRDEKKFRSKRFK